MKCQYCGNNLGLEEKFCPHCGKPNEQAAKHLADMQEYKEDYTETKNEVIKKSRKLNERSSRMAIIAVMVVIVAILLGLAKYYDDFDIRQEKKQQKIAREVEKNRSSIDATLKEMVEHRDYLAMDYFVLNYKLNHDDNYNNYTRVFSAACSYRVLYDDILGIVGDYDHFGERQNKEWCDDMAIYINNWKMYVDGEFWHDTPDSPMHAGELGAFITDAKKDIQEMIQVYFDLSDKEASDMWDMEVEEISAMLYAKCVDLYPEENANE